jgi:hypothetical protein
MNKFVIAGLIVFIAVVAVLAVVLAFKTGYFKFYAGVISGRNSTLIVSQEKASDCLKFLTNHSGCSDPKWKDLCELDVENCLVNLSVQSGDPGYCFYSPPLSVSECYLKVAVALKDPSICNSMRGTRDYIYWCYLDVAYKAKDASLCNVIGRDGSHSQYYICMAMITHDKRYCPNIVDAENKDACQSGTWNFYELIP